MNFQCLFMPEHVGMEEALELLKKYRGNASGRELGNSLKKRSD